jgi:hypothetical protein
MKIIIITVMIIDHKNTPGNNNKVNDKLNKKINIALYINFIFFSFIRPIVFIMAKNIKSRASNDNDSNKVTFQLYPAAMYIVVGPSAPPIIAITDASGEGKNIFGNKIMAIITPVIMKTPENTQRIIFFLLSIYSTLPCYDSSVSSFIFFIIIPNIYYCQ